MFKTARWRSDKNKIKIVFKLHLQAAKVPDLGWEAVMVILVPADVGRPTVRSEKAAVRDGECHWPKPVYETVKFSRDSKSGKLHDKIYQFLVYETGSNKAVLLGECSINFVEFIEVTKPSSLTLPLKGNTAAILKVTIQRLADEASDANANGEMAAKPLRNTLQSQLSMNNDDEDAQSDEFDSREDGLLLNQHIQKFSSSRNLPAVLNSNVKIMKCYSFDAVSATSDASSGKFTPKESSVIHRSTLVNHQSVLSPLSVVGTPTNVPNGSGDWSGSSAPDGSTDESVSMSEAGLKGGTDDSDNNPEKQMHDMTRKLELSELELQTLRKQIVKESRRGQDLLKEINSLKDENSELRKELEEKGIQARKDDDNGKIMLLTNGEEDPWALLAEMKDELTQEKNANASLRKDMKKMQDSNSDLLVTVKELDELLDQRNRDILMLTAGENENLLDAEYRNALSSMRNYGQKVEFSEGSSELQKEQYALVLVEKKNVDHCDTYSLERKIIELNSEVEFYRKDREEMEMQMEQLALDYEIVKQENHDMSTKLEQSQLRDQLRMQYECSAHLAVISDLEAHVEFLEKEILRQAEAFEAEMACVIDERLEQEQRAIKAEEALRLAKWKNTNTIEHIHDEFKTLSTQISALYNAKEQLFVQLKKEANELRLKNSQLEELLKKSQGEIASLKGEYHVKIQQLLALVDFKSKEADKLVIELRNKSDELQNHKKSHDTKLMVLLDEVGLLKASIEDLSKERDYLLELNQRAKQDLVDMELLKASNSGKDEIMKKQLLEIELVKQEVSSFKEKAICLSDELTTVRNANDEKEMMVKSLKSEVEYLKTHLDDLESSLNENKKEKNRLAVEIQKLCAIQGNEDCLTCSASKKDIGSLSVSDGTDNTDRELKFEEGIQVKSPSETTKIDTGTCRCDTSSNNNGGLGGDSSEDVNSVSSSHQHSKDEGLDEIVRLKERNTVMEEELKELQERYSEISLKFAEVEGERQQLVMTVRALKNAMKH